MKHTELHVHMVLEPLKFVCNDKQDISKFQKFHLNEGIYIYLCQTIVRLTWMGHFQICSSDRYLESVVSILSHCSVSTFKLFDYTKTSRFLCDKEQKETVDVFVFFLSFNATSFLFLYAVLTKKIRPKMIRYFLNKWRN